MPPTLAWITPYLSLLTATLLFVVHLLVVARAITRRNRTPASRVAWVAVIMLVPLVGVIAYLLLGEVNIGPERLQRLTTAEAEMALPPDYHYVPEAVSQRTATLFDFGQSINGFSPVAGNRIELLGQPGAAPDAPTRDCDAALAALITDIDAATEHVHICFYIWLDDGNGGRVADAVAAAAQRGVTCRVMVDALGSRAFRRSPRWQQLADAGVFTVAALNDIPRLGGFAAGRVDLRNHRKIVVIDNRIAYCGSQNCADPAFEVEAKYAPWIDLLLRCEGPVVRQHQHLFLSAWLAETDDDALVDALAPLPAAEPLPASFVPGAVAQAFGTGPTSHGNAMSDMFVATMYTAQKELLITTPYFVPDEAILRALCAAPRRGVQTTIVFPSRNNSRAVGAACRSCYADLLHAGVSIAEYPLGLLHSKSITVDGQIALVGSANLDRRSLELNYENNMLIADAEATAAIRDRQLAYLSVSTPVELTEVRQWGLLRRMVQNTVGMMSPLL